MNNDKNTNEIKKPPFPQADVFEKIISILNIDDESLLKDKVYVSKLLGGIHERQVAYYISASMYLGLLTNDKKFTDVANKLREKSSIRQSADLAILILSNKVFGEVYFLQKIYGEKFDVDDVVDIMKENEIEFDSEAMYKRRARTVMCWVQWINDLVN